VNARLQVQSLNKLEFIVNLNPNPFQQNEVINLLDLQDKTESPRKSSLKITLLELVLVYTDYGYGHVDLVKHGSDLELPPDTIENLLTLLRETTTESKEEVKENAKLNFLERFE
jgi:hypothetical protein